MQDRSVSIRTTESNFRNAILQCSKTEIPHAKSRNNKVSNGIDVRIEKVGHVYKLCFMLMHVFRRISVKWRNLTRDILAYRAVVAPNFIEKASQILVSKEIICVIILI